MNPDVSSSTVTVTTPENRLELSSGGNTVIGVIWEDINQRTSDDIRNQIEQIQNTLYNIESSYNYFALIIQNITRQGLRYIPRIGSWDLCSPSIFIRRTYEFFYDLPQTIISREARVSIEEQYLTVLMEILNTRPIRIHLNNNKTGHNAANEGILEFKEQHSGERDKYCDDAFDLITLEPITGDDVIYIKDPDGGKMCYERITFLRILESTVWVTLSLEHFIKSVKIMAKIFYIPEQEFTYSESAKKLDQLFKKIIQKKYENIDNGNNHTTFYPQVFKKVFDMYRLFKDPINRWMPHEAFLMILENPHIKNFEMVQVEETTGNEFYSVQTMWSGVSAVHEKQLFMLYPMGYNGAKLSYNDLNCNQDRYFHPIVESGGMDTFVVSYFNRYYRANP